MKKYFLPIIFTLLLLLTLSSCSTVAFQDEETAAPSPRQKTEKEAEEPAEPVVPSGQELLEQQGKPETKPSVPASKIDEAYAQGQALVESRCVLCHTLDRINIARKDRAAWGTTIDNMIKKGAALSPDEKITMLDYLAPK